MWFQKYQIISYTAWHRRFRTDLMNILSLLDQNPTTNPPITSGLVRGCQDRSSNLVTFHILGASLTVTNMTNTWGGDSREGGSVLPGGKYYWSWSEGECQGDNMITERKQIKLKWRLSWWIEMIDLFRSDP